MNNTTYELIGFGKCGKVFSDGNIAIKRYFDNCYINRISWQVFDILKTIDSNSLIKLLDYNIKNTHNKEVIDSYSYKYVNSINDLMIELPMEYTYETLSQFQKLLYKLNENNIAIFDADEKNVIKSSNGLVIIDPDLYSIDISGCKSDLKDSNKEYIVQYITSVWKEEYIQKYNLSRTEELYNTLFELDNIVLDSNFKNRFNYKNPEMLINNLVKKRSL